MRVVPIVVLVLAIALPFQAQVAPSNAAGVNPSGVRVELAEGLDRY